MELRSKRGADITTLPYEEVGSTMADAPRKVLRNTYMLLGLNLAFSALIAGVGAAMAWPSPGILLTLAGYFGLLFAVSRFRDSGIGVMLTFALTGFMGYTIGPLLSSVIALPGGGQIVTMALGATAGVFLAIRPALRATRVNVLAAISSV